MLDFLGIGAQKAGTTWLMMRLRQHPKIVGSPAGKELHYFDVLYGMIPKPFRLERLQKIVGKRVTAAKEKGNVDKAHALERLMDPSFAFTEDWYRECFSLVPDAKTKGEITPNYCALPDEGVQYVKSLLPDARIIYMVRDPYDRALSSLRMMASHGNATASDVIERAGFLARGDYAANVPRWDRAFGEQVLYLPFGDIKSRPDELIQQVEDHIGVERFDGYRKMERKVNSSADRENLVDDDPRERLKDIVAPQYDFLARRFGEEFVARIK